MKIFRITCLLDCKNVCYSNVKLYPEFSLAGLKDMSDSNTRNSPSSSFVRYLVLCFLQDLNHIKACSEQT